METATVEIKSNVYNLPATLTAKSSGQDVTWHYGTTTKGILSGAPFYMPSIMGMVSQGKSIVEVADILTEGQGAATLTRLLTNAVRTAGLATTREVLSNPKSKTKDPTTGVEVVTEHGLMMLRSELSGNVLGNVKQSEIEDQIKKLADEILSTNASLMAALSGGNMEAAMAIVASNEKLSAQRAMLQEQLDARKRASRESADND